MSRARHLLIKYGITEKDYDDLYRKQQGRCAVCKRSASEFKSRLCVDHDHGPSREVRGLLCHFCNRRVVGRFRRDKGHELLLAAYEYLARPEYTGWIVPLKTKRKKRRTKRK